MCPCCKRRRGCRAAEKADELASFHGHPEAKTANGINTHVYRGRGWDVRFGSKADCPLWAKSGHGILFDHVVGLRKQRWWDRYAERLSRLEINHQLVLGWRLHGKVAELLALEDAIDVTRGGC